MKIDHFLICDDIRTEISGKHTLVGVYDENIFFTVRPDQKGRWPKQLKLGIFAKIAFEGAVPDAFTLRLKVNEKERELGRGKIQIVGQNSKFQFVMVINNFVFEEKGRFTFFFDFLGADGALLETLSPDYSLLVEEKVTQ